MLSNIFSRLLLPSIRSANTSQRSVLRLLSTMKEDAPTSPGTASADRQKGTVRRFSKEKGYGFITKESDGTDCFVHFKSINTSGFKTLLQGQEVEFSTAQGEKGLEAKEVTVVGQGTSSEASDMDSFNNNSTSTRFGLGARGGRSRSPSSFDFGEGKSSSMFTDEFDSRPPRKSSNLFGDVSSSNADSFFQSRTPRSSSDGKRETGSVKRWTAERGFGFIRRANGGPDLFCHARSLKDGLPALEEGQTVQFRVQSTEKGEEARDVTVSDGETSTTEQFESESPATPGQRQKGTVKRWIAEKGFGFIRRDGGGSDIFVHLRGLSDGAISLQEGQSVEFDLVQSDKGEIAQNVTVSEST